MKDKIIACLTLFAISCAIVVVCYDFLPYFKEEKIFSQKTSKGRFTKIYDLNYWTTEESGPSGIGGVKDESIPYLEFLQDFIDRSNLRTIVDLGCGDFLLMKYIKIPKNTKYIGVDIVDALVDKNSKQYSKDNIKFEAIDNLSDFEKYSGDLLIVKDVIQILTIDQIFYIIKTVLPKYKYAIIVSNFFSLRSQHPQNADIIDGDSRGINLEIAPFNMNIEVIKDYHCGSRYKRIYLYTNPKNAN